MKMDPIQERQTAYRIRSLLNEGSENIAPNHAARLRDARQFALSRQKTEQLKLGFLPTRQAIFLLGNFTWLSRLSTLFIMLLMGVTLYIGLGWQQQHRSEEFAEFDIAMLIDDLPPGAYADHGFEVFLNNGNES